MSDKTKLIPLFDKDEDKVEVESIMNINLNMLQTGMTGYQINNFVLNHREHTNDLFLLKQVKLELYTRIQGLFELAYQYKKTKAEIDLANGEIAEIRDSKEMNNLKRDAKIRLQEIEIENKKYQLFNIKKQAEDKLRECKIFATNYDRLKYIEELGEEEIDRLEEEGWKIKAAYFSELIERYAITPRGYMPFPHEIPDETGKPGGLQGLINIVYKKQIEKEKAEQLLVGDNNG